MRLKKTLCKYLKKNIELTAINADEAASAYFFLAELTDPELLVVDLSLQLFHLVQLSTEFQRLHALLNDARLVLHIHAHTHTVHWFNELTRQQIIS